MFTHFNAKIDDALDQLKKGKNIFGGSPTKMVRALTLSRSLGKKYFTGCDNVDDDGRCAGHPDDSF